MTQDLHRERMARFATCEVSAPDSGGEVARRRNISIKPGGGARAVLTARQRVSVAAA